jgi:hypothetical protein
VLLQQIHVQIAVVFEPGLVALVSEPPKNGGTVAALRNSPLIGADLNLSRSRAAGRKIDF